MTWTAVPSTGYISSLLIPYWKASHTPATSTSPSSATASSARVGLWAGGRGAATRWAAPSRARRTSGNSMGGSWGPDIALTSGLDLGPFSVSSRVIGSGGTDAIPFPPITRSCEAHYWTIPGWFQKQRKLFCKTLPCMSYMKLLFFVLYLVGTFIHVFTGCNFFACMKGENGQLRHFSHIRAQYAMFSCVLSKS